MKYSVTYTCGHVGTIHLIGPQWSREGRITFLERGECFDCYKTRTNEAAHEQAEKLELPALVGSEKQIAWAEKLRIQKLQEIEAVAERLTGSKEYRQILIAVERISNEISAKQWIEWREDLPKQIINTLFQTMKAAPTEEQQRQKLAEQQEAEAIRRAALVEATIRPETAISEMAAEVAISGKVIAITFPEKREDFRALVKSIGYQWGEGHWKRTITTFAGPVSERVVELGHTLLAGGFLVRMFDAELRARIVAGDFIPEQTRWISKLVGGEYIGWLNIQWGRNEDYYNVARKLPNSKYRRPGVVVPSAQCAQILDFAERYDFCLSPGAQEALRLAQEDKAAMLVAVKAPLPPRKKLVASDTPPVLVIPEHVEVADELRDN